MYPHIDFYKIEVFYNNDQTIDAFLYLRITGTTSYCAKSYNGDVKWDLSGAKLDLLSDGTTFRKLLSSITVDPMCSLIIRKHLGFTAIGDCPALDDVAFAAHYDSKKIADIFFDDGAFPVIRTVIAGRQAYDHDVVREFLLK